MDFSTEKKKDYITMRSLGSESLTWHPMGVTMIQLVVIIIMPEEIISNSMPLVAPAKRGTSPYWTKTIYMYSTEPK